jgi:protein TonB
MDLFDVVFENRNKDYGAYDLRKKYVKYLAISLAITFGLALILTGYALAYKFYTIKPINMPKGILYEPSYISQEELAVPELPEEPLKEPKPDELTENFVVEDSVKMTPKKPKEVLPKNENTEEKDSSASGGNVGLANGDITVPIERMPQFPGGEQAMGLFLQKNIQVNLRPTIKRIRGVVVVSFVVRRDGSVGDVKIARSLSPELDQICLRVVKAMPLWSPAISGGHPIEIIHNLPITF